MTTVNPFPRRGSYGVNAPALLIIPLVVIIAGLVQLIVSPSPWSLIGIGLVLACLGSGLYTMRRGQFLVWADALDQVRLTGGEQVLDLGCGRGAVLLLAAQRLTTGRAVGIDLWRRQDQAGNAIAVTQRNAVAEGVAERVELQTADMRSLPFADASFDLVVSSLAIHNLRIHTEHDAAIDEAVRVLRPGGHLVVADIRATDHYAARLRDGGMSDVRVRGAGWRMWWSGPWLATTFVTATKLSAASHTTVSSSSVRTGTAAIAAVGGASPPPFRPHSSVNRH